MKDRYYKGFRIDTARTVPYGYYKASGTIDGQYMTPVSDTLANLRYLITDILAGYGRTGRSARADRD